ncbi:hypothetical protein J1614_006778 [Plenodomus biglobosus]|nr:hypothetical protein J1614_006778 [Plenodomus biglobosus]
MFRGCASLVPCVTSTSKGIWGMEFCPTRFDCTPRLGVDLHNYKLQEHLICVKTPALPANCIKPYEASDGWACLSMPTSQPGVVRYYGNLLSEASESKRCILLIVPKVLSTEFAPHTYRGCFDIYNETAPDLPLLAGPAYINMVNATQESCRYYCVVMVQPPSKYFGLDNGSNCRCDNSLSFIPSDEPTFCQSAALGNSAQAAGDIDHMNVWENADYVTPTQTGLAPASSPTGITSPDGSCGGTTGYHCIGYVDGECCSQYGYCGLTENHCLTGCQPFAGRCGRSNIPGFTTTQYSVSSTDLSAPTATPSGLITSPDGSCGPDTNYHCLGYVDGECCSPYNYCGGSNDHCEAGCQSDFGKCREVVSASQSSSTEAATPASPSATVRLNFLLCVQKLWSANRNKTYYKVSIMLLGVRFGPCPL